jgi:hypothetical protein
MKPRDLLTLLVIGAVVVIGGFAAADAIRGNPGPERATPATTTPVQTSPSRLPGPQPQPDAPAGWPQGEFRGTLTFTDAKSCAIREIGLAGGRERPVAHFRGDCSLWTPLVGSRFAYGLGPSSLDGLQPFRIANVALANADLGGYRALFGVVIWSSDGQRIAWCGRDRTGFDLEIGGPSHRLPRCPVAYTPDNRIAYAVGNRLIVDGKTVVKTDEGITYAHYGTDGSLAVVVGGERLLRYAPDGRLTGTFSVPDGRTPILSPRNCAAFFRPFNGPGEILFRDLGCFSGSPPDAQFGVDAAWSPDGTAYAIAGPDAIVFHRIGLQPRTARWPAAAARMAWRPD